MNALDVDIFSLRFVAVLKIEMFLKTARILCLAGVFSYSTNTILFTAPSLLDVSIRNLKIDNFSGFSTVFLVNKAYMHTQTYKLYIFYPFIRKHSGVLLIFLAEKERRRCRLVCIPFISSSRHYICNTGAVRKLFVVIMLIL